MGEELYKFIGTCEYEKYYSEDSLYGAYNISVDNELPHSSKYNGDMFEGDDNITYFINIAGKMQRLYIGCKYEIEAQMRFNKRYNCWEYVPSSIKLIKSTTDEDNKKFLNSVLTTNQTESLLSVYPDIIDKVVNNEEIDLSKVKGIKDKSFNKIKDKILKAYGMSDLLIMLQPLGITLKQINKIKMLDENTDIVKAKITKNPYILTSIKGLGFKKVDGIALKINPNIRVSKERTIAFIRYFFTDLGNSKGDTLCKINELLNSASNIVPECLNIVKEIAQDCKDKHNSLLYINGDFVGLNEYVNTEKSILKILEFLEGNSLDYSDKIDFDKSINVSQNRLGFNFTNEQKNAIKHTINHGLTIITAKAGCGKTVTINGIIDLYKDVCKIKLCSLSAKASRRMTQATGQEANTIHKTLGFGQSQSMDEQFLYNVDNPLDCDILVVDEATMVNANLFLSILRAIKPTCKLVLVFDSEQLPPIGYGNVATDLLKSDFDICELTKVHRQALDSGILTDANMIRNQKFPIKNAVAKEVHGNNKDLCYMFRNDKQQIRDIVINDYLKTINKPNNSVINTVIITPRKQNCINSTLEINKIIQDKLISKDIIGINRGDVVFRKGCRIIQRVNDKDKEVVNGELGFITNIYKQTDSSDGKTKQYFKVKFDTKDNEIEFEKSDLSNMELGYCLTVHSCQGSEWDNVNICLDSSHYILLNSNLLYTALTRAKKRCLLATDCTGFKTCIKRKANKRRTWINYHFYKLRKSKIK